MSGLKTPMTAASLMNLLDAMYCVEQPRASWLSGILEAMTPALEPDPMLAASVRCNNDGTSRSSTINRQAHSPKVKR